MIEAEPVADIVGEQRLEVVRTLALRRRESGRSGKRRLHVVAEQSVGVEDLSGKCSRRALANGNARCVRRDDARECEHSAREPDARLVEADRVEPVEIALLIV